MKTSIISIWGLMILSCLSAAQQYEKVYLDQSDSTRFYFKVAPDFQAEGLLVLLPGSRGDAEWPLKTTKIPYLAADHGLVTIMINYEIWLCWLREDILDLLNESILDVLSEHNIPREKCVIGGFSGGGAIALNYTERAYKDSLQTSVIPKGVFSLDAPLDLTELFDVNNLEVDGFLCKGEQIKVTDETRIMLEKMTKYLGTPEYDLDNFYEHSVFIFNDRYHNGGNAIYLKDVPVRIYSGICANYMQGKSECGFYLDTSPFLVSFLKHHGNEFATFKSQYDEDYNPDGGEQFRGRHAWLGFDSDECVGWILQILKDR